MSKKYGVKTGTALATATLVGIMGAVGTTSANAAPAPANTQGNLALHNKALGTSVQKAAPRTTYKVRSGDTLWGISHKFGTTVAAIAQANSLRNVHLIYPGQTLIIPNQKTAPAPAPAASAPAPQAAPSAPASAASANSVYTVKHGDTLWGISRAHGVTIRSITAANRISNSSLIFPGQRLVIPDKNAPAATTPAAPAPAPAPVAPAAPAPAPAPAPQAAPSAPAPVASNDTVYTVQRGDTLWGIARAHGTSVNALVQLNRIADSSHIYVGQKLTISGTSSNASAATPAAPANPTQKQLVTNNFPGYTYPDATVQAANENKNALINSSVPSRAEVQSMIVSTAQQMGVDPRLALAHAFVESGFDATAVSPANAIGTMQVIPSSGVWASQLVGRDLNLLNPADNITAGIAIIRSLQNSASSLEEGIAGYYQGLGGVRRYGMRSDTVQYVAKVKAAMNRF
ncbi:lytic transglycosylase domain-containing protein [uncultured Arcanobacterium sp.]|uniref:lytic transglycosylase domain-containing protein n=1 Tax=uncultured Arcanobacterium sp. TaxID=487520 RepID=UPI00261272B9|nr:lytic transglycosylase domain-containing protein [uncultured Arcanobacterium sp.]